ncbi:MAG: hypothetical protein ACRC33_14375, partial [Gemmataceae bacterium]
WEDLGGTLGQTTSTVTLATRIQSDVTVTFNSTTAWFFGAAAATPADKYHFYSTALHETGHVVGLGEPADIET